MSIEHSVVCDRCGSTVSAHSTIALARSDAALLGARQGPGEDVCARCCESEPQTQPQTQPEFDGETVGAHRPGPADAATHDDLALRLVSDLADLADLFSEYVRTTVDIRLGEISGAATSEADETVGAAARAFAARMGR